MNHKPMLTAHWTGADPLAQYDEQAELDKAEDERTVQDFQDLQDAFTAWGFDTAIQEITLAYHGRLADADPAGPERRFTIRQFADEYGWANVCHCFGHAVTHAEIRRNDLLNRC